MSDIPEVVLHEDFGDWPALLNSRDWIKKALEAKGAKIIGAGCGMGQADLDVLIEGFPFSVSIRPR